MPTPIKAYFGNVPLFENGQTSTAGYVRPVDWLELPVAPPDGFHGLNAVYDQEENYVTVKMLTNDGSTYTIDWGDGNTTTAASNATIQYNYDFNNVALDGTLTTRGYKQAIVKVTPQAGKTFTLCDIRVKPTAPIGTFNAISSGWLDLNLNLPNLTTGRRLLLGDAIYVHRVLERVNITSWGAITDAQYIFFSCPSLQYVNDIEFNFANIENALSMFQSCGLERIDGTNWDTSNVVNFTAAFRDCPNLIELKCSNWNTSSCTNMSNMFNACASLRIVDMSQWNTMSLKNTSSMFFLCRSLETVDVSNFDMSKVTTISNMFGTCTSLQAIDISNWNLPVCLNASNFVNACPALRKLGSCSFSAVTTIGAFSNSCSSLTNVNISGIKVNLSLANCQLGASALNTLYTNLDTVVGQTITVTGNYGTASDDPTIATAKGWTVSG